MNVTSPIFKMFGRSPIKPLQEHMNTVHDCASALLPFFHAVLEGDWEKASLQQQAIANLEKKADQLKKDLRLHLPSGLFMPVPRTDVLEILGLQDRIANKAEDIAGLILGRQLQIPEAIAQPFLQFVERSIDASKQARIAINELDELLETGFSGSEVTLVEEMINKLDEIERDTDEMQIVIRRKLFSIEKELSPIDVMFLYKIIEWTGELADRAETVGAQLEVLLAR